MTTINAKVGCASRVDYNSASLDKALDVPPKHAPVAQLDRASDFEFSKSVFPNFCTKTQGLARTKTDHGFRRVLFFFASAQQRKEYPLFTIPSDTRSDTRISG